MACSTIYSNVVETQVASEVIISTRYITDGGSISTVVVPIVSSDCVRGPTNGTDVCTATTSFSTSTQSIAVSTCLDF
jgi:hypothetical protein